MDIRSTVKLMSCMGSACFTMVLAKQGNPCYSTWSASSPPFFINLGVCRVVSPLTWLLQHGSLCFLALLKYIMTAVLQLLLMGLTSVTGKSILEPDSTDSIRQQWTFLAASHSSHFYHLLPKPCPRNPVNSHSDLGKFNQFSSQFSTSMSSSLNHIFKKDNGT